MSASEAVTRTKQGVEGLVQKTAEAVTPAGTDEDLNPWKKTPLSDDTEKRTGGEELTKEDFERAAQKAQARAHATSHSLRLAHNEGHHRHRHSLPETKQIFRNNINDHLSMMRGICYCRRWLGASCLQYVF
jgi:hypothetical protein